MIGQQIGDAFQSTMRHVSTGIQLARGLSVQGLAESFDTSSLFGSVDASGLDASGLDASGLDMSGYDMSGLDISGASFFKSNKSNQSRYHNIRRMILTVLGYLFTLLICSFVANDMIGLPWFVRLFGFAFVFLSSYIHPLLFIGIVLYYLCFGLYNVVTGSGRILPRIYTLLPLRVARGNGFDTALAPFTYLFQGEEGSAYGHLKKTQATYLANLIAAFPAYESLKGTFSLAPLVKNVETYMKGLNATEYVPKKATPPSAATSSVAPSVTPSVTRSETPSAPSETSSATPSVPPSETPSASSTYVPPPYVPPSETRSETPSVTRSAPSAAPSTTLPVNNADYNRLMRYS